MGDEMTSKIRIKLGPIEVEYEGTESFLKEELPQLLEAVANLYKQSGIPEMCLQPVAFGVGMQSTQCGVLRRAQTQLLLPGWPEVQRRWFDAARVPVAVEATAAHRSREEPRPCDPAV